jgi:hypothetical protein
MLEKWNKFLAELTEKEYEYAPHFSIRLVQRRLSLPEVINCLKNPDKLIAVKPYLVNNDEKEFRLFFKLSSKFNLVLGVKKPNKHLYIKTVFRDNKKWKVPTIKKR